jgi:hypothetical protein
MDNGQITHCYCRRHTSGVFAASSHKIPIICSSLNPLLFICPAPFSDGLYLLNCWAGGGRPGGLTEGTPVQQQRVVT